jgi:hypothetical protein
VNLGFTVTAVGAIAVTVIVTLAGAAFTVACVVDAGVVAERHRRRDRRAMNATNKPAETRLRARAGVVASCSRAVVAQRRPRPRARSARADRAWSSVAGSASHHSAKHRRARAMSASKEPSGCGSNDRDTNAREAWRRTSWA